MAKDFKPLEGTGPMEMPGVDLTTYIPEFRFDDRFIPRYEPWEIPRGSGIIVNNLFPENG